MAQFELVTLKQDLVPSTDLSAFSEAEARKAHDFHASFDVYEETPLTSLPHLAQALGVKSIHVKDESRRFGLNAFKVLGGSYALGRYIAQTLGEDISDLPARRILSPETKEKLGDLTFFTATDGNHGRGVAWTARQLGQKAVVYMPKGSSPERLNNIRAEGADATITELNYDGSVELAKRHAEDCSGVIVQDTAWEGYEDIPRWIMQGYTTMGYEIVHQLDETPTHLFLQAGVGSMAGAMAGFFAAYYGKERPHITVVEPNSADCIFRTAKANDGQLHIVDGDLNTIMAGLACGVPCSLGWEILRHCADAFIRCPDYAAADGMRILAAPLAGDPAIISGESGAATLGCAANILLDDELRSIKEQLKLDENSRLLFISTEGDTDRENYRQIVWRGKYAKK